MMPAPMFFVCNITVCNKKKSCCISCCQLPYVLHIYILYTVFYYKAKSPETYVFKGKIRMFKAFHKVELRGIEPLSENQFPVLLLS